MKHKLLCRVRFIVVMQQGGQRHGTETKRGRKTFLALTGFVIYFILFYFILFYFINCIYLDRKFAANVGVPFKTPEVCFLGTEEPPFGWDGINPSEVPKNLQLYTGDSPLTSDSQEMIILVGCAASGKSTFARTHLVPKGYVHINQVLFLFVIVIIFIINHFYLFISFIFVCLLYTLGYAGHKSKVPKSSGSSDSGGA